MEMGPSTSGNECTPSVIIFYKYLFIAVRRGFVGEDWGKGGRFEAAASQRYLRFRLRFGMRFDKRFDKRLFLYHTIFVRL